MRDFVEYLLMRNIANYDSMVLLTALKGKGKSSMAIQIGRAWCKLLGIAFDPNRHMAYTNQQVVAKIDYLKPFEPLICLTKNTKIIVKENNTIKQKNIMNLVNKKDYEILTYNIKENVCEWKKPKKTIRTGKAEVYEIELEDGLKIKATADHLFYTQRGYVKLKELSIEDKILRYEKECPICKIKFNPNVADKVYCSKKCLKKGNYINNKNKILNYLKEYRLKNKDILKKKLS
jgi:hypothetical protein